MLELKDITIQLKKDGRMLAEGFSFTLGKGDKAVIVGEEGNGKSTLLKAVYDPSLVEEYCEFSGLVTARGRLAYLPQLMEGRPAAMSLGEYFEGTEYYRHPEVPESLGLRPEFFFGTQKLGSLSGGEKVKAQLARLLLGEPDVLLLDEPTNDLDLPTLRWLEGFLRDTRLPVLYISHDETLIENTANVILHMEQLIRKTRCRITVTREDYRSYLARRRQSFDRQAQVARKQRDEHEKQQRRWQQIYDRVDHEQRSISRQNPSGGRLLKKKMHSVIATGKRLERETEDFTEFPEEEEAIITFFDPAVRLPAGKTVLDWSSPQLTVGERVLARDVSLRVAGPAAVGITGRNGAGKSTLLRALWEELRPRRDLRAAYMPQDYAEVLDYARTPLEHLSAVYDKETLTRARSCLGSMRFTREEMTGKIAALSGGQRAKLLLLDMVLQGANVLLLDEPTRNFSPLSAPVVRAALREFGGAIISVSHDRKYLSEVCTAVYELTPEGLRRVEVP
ncbi:MAG: ABC-F family ATP-binding cassette domain-containing protein [Oscillospiraceae bacterium]|nr:ABC-F family ATP-binding cassette domain-containing protein [Oscillospiraceae bacterium]